MPVLRNAGSVFLRRIQVKLQVRGKESSSQWISKELWDVLLCFLLCFYLISLPFIMSGCMTNDFGLRYIGIIVCGYIADAIMVVNMGLNMFYFPVVNSDGITIRDKWKIYDIYCQGENFVLLFASLFPLDAILIAPFGVNVIPVVRLLKLIHMRYFNFYLHRFGDWLYNIGIEISFEVFFCF